MVLQAVPLMIPLAADGVTQVQHPAEIFRSLGKSISRRSGVVKPGSAYGLTNAGDFALTVVPGAMQATIAAGAAFVVGQETTLQGAGCYYAYSEAIETISWPAASGSNRMDSLLLQCADPQYGSIGGNPLGASWRAVAGSSASARPDTDFKSGGSQYVPGAWVRMYDVLVPASATQLTQANVAFKAGYSGVNGAVPFFSAARPAGAYVGEHGYEVDTSRRFIWNGTAWTWPYPRGIIGGVRFSGTGNFNTGMTGAEALVTNFSSGAIALEATRSFEIRCRFFAQATANNTYAIFRIRDTNLAGTERISPLVYFPLASNVFQVDVSATYETTTAEASHIFVLTEITTSGGTLTVSGGTANRTAFIEVVDRGPSLVLTASALP